jgi:hypothetical protein
VTCLAAITFNRVAAVKAREQAIALDFILHYLETLRGVSFSNLRPGMPINNLCDGTGGAPNIRIPTDTTFFPIDTEDYETFHPELAWLSSQRPEMQVVLSEQGGGSPAAKLVHVEVRWQAPLGRGSTNSVQLDAFRVNEL